MGTEDLGARLSERRWWGTSARSTRHLTTCSAGGWKGHGAYKCRHLGDMRGPDDRFKEQDNSSRQWQ